MANVPLEQGEKLAQLQKSIALQQIFTSSADFPQLTIFYVKLSKTSPVNWHV